MARPNTPRRRPEAPSAPTTLHEITRRYYACAIALAKAMSVPMSETFMREHRESISCCFIEAGRAGVRLPSAVPLPPLPQATGVLHSEFSADGHPVEPVTPLVDLPVNGHPPEADGIGCTGGLSPEPPAPRPTTIPKDAGLPCAGVAIADLKPAQLAMLVSKTARLVHDEGERWVPLLASLQAERAARLARGRKPTPTPEGPADVP
jgi:hypothetical protein